MKIIIVLVISTILFVSCVKGGNSHTGKGGNATMKNKIEKQK